MDITPPAAYLSIGDFEYQSNPWNKGELVERKDFTQTLHQLDGGALRVAWSWPSDLVDIVSYPGFIWGQKPWSTVSTTTELPVRLDAGAQIDVAIDLDWAPPPRGNFNVAFDLWVASQATESAEARLGEIMIWIKNWDWENEEEPVARFTDANGSGSIFHRADHAVLGDTWSYTAVVYDEDVKRGTIDLDALLERLASLGILNRTHLLMDVELGTEILNGAGWLEINQLDMIKDGETFSLVEAAAALP